MDALNQLLQQRQDYPAAIELLEEMELRGELDGGRTALLFTLYLVEFRVDDAHFLFLRLPQQILESTPQFKALKSIQEAMASQPAPVTALAGLVFPDLLQPFIMVLQERLKKKSADLLRKSYSVVTLSFFAQSLGLTPEEAIATSAVLGWAYNATSESLLRLDAGAGDIAHGVAQLSLQQISSTIQKLETK
eukprot:m.59826 g.59826  ORF g.59826 m.59826 type:complete len:191 (-) comp17376_c0_seq1:3388-3960(-)